MATDNRRAIIAELDVNPETKQTLYDVLDQLMDPLFELGFQANVLRTLSCHRADYDGNFTHTYERSAHGKKPRLTLDLKYKNDARGEAIVVIGSEPWDFSYHYCSDRPVKNADIPKSVEAYLKDKGFIGQNGHSWIRTFSGILNRD